MAAAIPVIALTGTGTEVGKTWVGVQLIEILRTRGVSVGAWKPAQSFEAGADHTDADLLGAASGQTASEVCPRHRWYERPLAPPMAAHELGRDVPRLDDYMGERPRARHDVLLVEGAGGLRSPIAEDGDCLQLFERLTPALYVVVADAHLGAIHAVRATCMPLAPAATAVLLNRFDSHDKVHRLNLAWLRDKCEFEIYTTVSSLINRLLETVKMSGETR